MNVLHIVALDNNQANGVSIVVPEHVKNQSKMEKVALLNCSGISPNHLEENINFEIYNRDLCPDGNIKKLPKPFDKPDIVIFHGIYFYYFIKVMRFLNKRKIPYIIVPHGSLTSYAQHTKYFKKTIGNLLYFNKFINNSVALQYLTLNEKQMSSRFKNNYFICGNGMYIRDNKIVERNRNKEGKFQLTFIGRLDIHHKGLDVLIEACNKISKEMRRYNIHLSIFGPDHRGGRKKIESEVKELGLGDIISIGGALYGIEKQRELEDSDVFILTSRYEGQPLAAMEALAMGLPVLLTPGTNIANDVLKYKCGWKADFSVQSIAEKIIEAFNSKSKLNIFSTNAINLVKNNYSWEYVAKKNIEEYKNVLTKFLGKGNI